MELRVPVYRVEVGLFLAAEAASERAVTLFLPPDFDLEQVFTAPEPFLPAEERGSVRWFARSAVVALSRRVEVAEDDDGLPRERRAVVAHLAGGATIDGELRWIPTAHTRRTTDVLNLPTASFAIHQRDRIVHVAKQHVRSIEEAVR